MFSLHLGDWNIFLIEIGNVDIVKHFGQYGRLNDVPEIVEIGTPFVRGKMRIFIVAFENGESPIDISRFVRILVVGRNDEIAYILYLHYRFEFFLDENEPVGINMSHCVIIIFHRKSRLENRAGESCHFKVEDSGERDRRHRVGRQRSL